MRNKGIKIKEIIKQHILNNSKEYIIITLLFIIGIFLGVLYINNMQETPKLEIKEYLQDFIEKMKTQESLDTINLLKASIWQNGLIALTIWFFGTTVIGIPIVFGIIIYRGFCLGYTISACVFTLGMTKGILFILISIFLQNLIFIPAILALAVSGFKLYKSIVKNKQKENIKIEMVRHTIFSLVMLMLLCISSLIEIFISTNILQNLIKYF
jgi:stage II sporulation protein M